MASITTTGRIVGMKEFADNINKLGQDIGKKVLQRATYRAILKWRDRARQLAPVSSAIHVSGRKSKFGGYDYRKLITPGNLRRNIKVRKLREFRGQFSKEARYGIIVTRDAWYWFLVEFGVPAYGIPPKSFMRETFQFEHQFAFMSIVDEARDYIYKLQRKGDIYMSNSMLKDFGIGPARIFR